MTDAPERIWAYSWHQYEQRNGGDGQTEYIRADVAQAMVAEAEARGRAERLAEVERLRALVWDRARADLAQEAGE